MIQKIYNSVYVKSLALLLATSILCMSFKRVDNGEVVLNSGTYVPLETMSMIRSDQVSIGQIIDFRIKYDVKVGDKTVIPAGSIAKGQVMLAQSARGVGKQGFVKIQVTSVQAVDGQEVFLSGGNVFQEGEDQQMLSILLGVFVCILFLTMKGKNAEVPPGYSVNAYVATTVTIKV